MIRDYAKSNSSRKKKKKGMAPIIIVIALLFPLALFYGNFYKVIHNRGKLPKVVKSVNQEKNAPSSLSEEDSKIQFDFYTLLPKMAVQSNAPTENNTIPVAAIKKAPFHTIPLVKLAKPNIQSYVLQIASFKEVSDAQQLRNQLSKLGFPVFIQDYHSADVLWFRLLVGPYLSLAQAQTDQKRLSEDHIKSIVFRLKTSTRT